MYCSCCLSAQSLRQPVLLGFPQETVQLRWWATLTWYICSCDQFISHLIAYTTASTQHIYGICWRENSTCVWLNKNDLFYNKNVSVGILTLTIRVKNKHSNWTQYDGSQVPAGITFQPTSRLPAAAISLNTGPISTTTFPINHFNTKNMGNEVQVINYQHYP